MKNKYKHGKAIAATTMALAAVSLVTVGFSAWVIAYQDTKDVDNIGVSVESITDQTVFITEQKATDNTIVLDAKGTDNENYITSTDGKEDLKFAISFKVDISKGKNFKGISIAATEKEAKLTTFKSDNYITLPFNMVVNANKSSTAPTNYIDLIDSSWTVNAKNYYVTYAEDFGTNLVSESDTTTWDTHINVARAVDVITYTVDFQIKWGSAFGGSNPSLYDDTVEKAGEAKTALENMKKAGQISFDLTLKHDPLVTVDIAKA